MQLLNNEFLNPYIKTKRSPKMNETKIRIILVDDHPIVRQSWKILLDNNPKFQVVAELENGARAIELAEELIPDIMLVDLNMSPLNGFTVTQSVMAKNPSIKIIGISINTHPRYATRMIELGAKGYITKTSSLEEIIHCITEVYNGSVYICEEIRRNSRPASNHDSNDY
jgi:two-component system, NarL family, invasion response regulator UvrY